MPCLETDKSVAIALFPTTWYVTPAMKFKGKSGIAKHCKRRDSVPISVALSERLNAFISAGAKKKHAIANTVMIAVAKPSVNKYADFTRSKRFAL